MVNNQEDRLHRYRAKRLRFMINGDKFFPGVNYALNTEKIRSFDALLNDLTSSLMDHIKLCKGVRYIFNSKGETINLLTEFQDGNTYFCSSIDLFVTTEYRINNGTLNWLVRNSACISSSRVKKSARQSINHVGDETLTTNTTIRSDLTPNPKISLTSTKLASQYSSNSTGSSNRSNGSNNTGTRNNISNINFNGLASPKIANNRSSKSKTSHPATSKNHINHQQTTPINSASSRTPKRTTDSKNLSQRSSNTPNRNQQSRNLNPKSNQKDKSDNNITSGATDEKPYEENHLSKENTTSNPTDNRLATEDTLEEVIEDASKFGPEVKAKYDIGRAIGDGHFSVVYCCMNRSNKQYCALKLIDKYKCRGRDDMIYNEVKILKQLDHPNIVKLIEEFDYPEQLYLILELVHDGDLFDAISNVTIFSEVHVATMIFNLSSALTYLHEQGIVHRDIKPENLLISIQEDGSHSLKLADFGLAVDISDNRNLFSVCGTAFYVSPEMLNETGYDFKVDVWSTGVICFILLCGYPPFTSKENESNQDELFDAILAGDFQFAPPYWSKISQHAKNLIKYMLIVDPEKRYTAEQVFKHPWTMGTSSNFDGIDPFNMSRRIALSQSP